MSVQKFSININGQGQSEDLVQYLKRIETVLQSWYGWSYSINIVHNTNDKYVFSLDEDDIPPLELVRAIPYFYNKNQTVKVPLIRLNQENDGFFTRYSNMPARIYSHDFNLDKPSAHWNLDYIKVFHGNEPVITINRMDLAVFKINLNS